MRMLAFAERNVKEIVRDPLSVIFGVGFPVVLLLMIHLLKSSLAAVPGELFPMQTFAPGMAMFGLSFLSLFLGMLVAGDRESSFLMRIYASPLKSVDYIFGYSLPMIPVAAVQTAVCFAVSVLLGLEFSWRILSAMAALLPAALLFIMLGMLLGSLLSNRQVGGISSVVVNVAMWLSGVWFDLEMIGGTFAKICRLLPFSHAVDAASAALNGDGAAVLGHLLWVLGYATVIGALAVAVFRKKMKG